MRYMVEDKFPFKIMRYNKNPWLYKYSYDSMFMAYYEQSKKFIKYYNSKLETQGKKKHPVLRKKIKKHQDKMKKMIINHPEEFI